MFQVGDFVAVSGEVLGRVEVLLAWLGGEAMDVWMGMCEGGA